MPESIKSISPKVFLLGVLWAFVAAAGPVCGVIALWFAGVAPEPQWRTLWQQAAFHGGLGVVAFWRKNKALLQLPPTLQQVKSLVTTTVQATETVTISEAHVEVASPTAK